MLEAGSRSGRDRTARPPRACLADYTCPRSIRSPRKTGRWHGTLWSATWRRDAERRSRPADHPTAGVLYPRASALGGCTAHNAMIFMAPHNSDWNAIAELTGDASWRAEHAPVFRAHRGLPLSPGGAAAFPADRRVRSNPSRARLEWTARKWSGLCRAGVRATVALMS